MFTQILQLPCNQLWMCIHNFQITCVDVWKHASKTTFLLHIKYPQQSRAEEDKCMGKDNVYFLKM